MTTPTKSSGNCGRWIDCIATMRTLLLKRDGLTGDFGVGRAGQNRVHGNAVGAKLAAIEWVMPAKAAFEAM
jgi:hypothetical protein